MPGITHRPGAQYATEHGPQFLEAEARASAMEPLGPAARDLHRHQISTADYLGNHEVLRLPDR